MLAGYCVFRELGSRSLKRLPSLEGVSCETQDQFNSFCLLLALL